MNKSSWQASRNPKHVVITGATSGMGRALAMHYAVSGRYLSLAGRNPERLMEIVQACRGQGADAEGMQVDVTDAQAMRDWLSQRDTAIPIDMLIANAGMGGAQVVPTLSGEDGDLARQIIDVNTVGVLNTVTPVLSDMVRRQRGHIVIIGSISGLIGLPQSPVYCASKAAIQIYGDALRRLVKSKNVRITTVLPGFVDTPMSRSLDMPRPFCWSADKAVRRIASAVERGAPQYIFPWPLRAAIGLQNYIPVRLTDFILSRTIDQGSFKAPEQEEG